MVLAKALKSRDMVLKKAPVVLHQVEELAPNSKAWICQISRAQQGNFSLMGL